MNAINSFFSALASALIVSASLANASSLEELERSIEGYLCVEPETNESDALLFYEEDGATKLVPIGDTDLAAAEVSETSKGYQVTLATGDVFFLSEVENNQWKLFGATVEGPFSFECQSLGSLPKSLLILASALLDKAVVEDLNAMRRANETTLSKYEDTMALLRAANDKIAELETEVKLGQLSPISRVPAFVERAVAEPTDQVRYGIIVDYLRDYQANAACFAALPTVSGINGALELDTFGLRSEILASFTAGLAREAGRTPTTYQTEITAAQCAALRFVTGLRDYPAFSLTIDLDQRDIPQPGYLNGDIRHFGDRIVHLLLVDDAGNVLVLDGFLRDRDAAQHFEIGPLTQTEEGVVTRQLLVALALPAALPVLKAAVSAGAMPAETFFGQLATELTPELEAELGVGLVAFAVGAP